jgi:hypothetical protein
MPTPRPPIVCKFPNDLARAKREEKDRKEEVNNQKTRNMNPKIKFLSSIDNKPIQPSYLPLESFIDYKKNREEEKKLNPPSRLANDSALSSKKMPAEVAAEKASASVEKD